MRKINLSELPESALPAEAGTVLRRFTGGENLTLARITFAKGSVLPVHAHPNEQFTVVLAGTLRFTGADGDITDVHAGEAMHLPPHVPHGATALTDATVLDVFAPVRADWGTPPEA